MIKYDERNIFLKIIKNEIPFIKVYEDTNTIAIMDAFPITPGHVLVLPKNKSRNIIDIKTNDLTKLMLIVQKIAQAQKIAFKADGIKIQHNCEEAGGQVVFHTHVHIIPFYREENKNFIANEDAEEQAKILRKHLQS